MSVTHEKPVPTQDVPERSTPELVQDLTRLVPQLARQEVELAKTELSEKARHAGVGVGAFGGAGLIALFGVGTLVTAAVLCLAEVVPAWAAALIVAAVLLAGAGAAALIGRRQLRRATPPLPRQAVAGTRQDVKAVKESAHR